MFRNQLRFWMGFTIGGRRIKNWCFPMKGYNMAWTLSWGRKKKKVATKKKIITIRFEINCLFCKKKNIEGRAEWRKNKKVLLSGIAVKPIKNVHAYKVWNCQFQQPLTQKSCVHSISVEELRFAFHFCRTLSQQRNTLVLRLRSVFLGNQKHDARFQHQIKIIVL